MPVEAPPPAQAQEQNTPPGSEDSLKAMAEKFRSLTTPATSPQPGGNPADGGQPPTGGDPKTPAGDPKTPKAPVSGEAPPIQIEDVEVTPTTPVTREHFKRLAQARDSYKQQATKLAEELKAGGSKAKELEAELAKVKAALPPNLEEIQKAIADAKRQAEENKTLTEQLETINLERSPRFQNWWKTETGKHLKVATAHVPVDQREQVQKLLMAPASPERDVQLDEILEPLSSTSKRIVTGAMEALESLKIQREEALTQGSAKYQELQAHEKAEAEKAAKDLEAKRQSLTEKALARAKNYSAFQPSGDAQADTAIAQREAFIRACMAGKVEEDVMLAMPAISMEYLHLTEKVIPGLKAELAKQSELIKTLQGSTPRAGDGARSGTKIEEPNDGNSFARLVKQNWQPK